MAKTLGKSRKIKELERYRGAVGVYDLSKTLKKGKIKTKFLVIARPKPVSGKPIVTIWASDEHGTVLDNTPMFSFRGLEVSEALHEIGFNLV